MNEKLFRPTIWSTIFSRGANSVSNKGILSHANIANVAEKANKNDIGDTGGINCNLRETNFLGSLEKYSRACLIVLSCISTPPMCMNLSNQSYTNSRQWVPLLHIIWQLIHIFFILIPCGPKNRNFFSQLWHPSNYCICSNIIVLLWAFLLKNVWKALFSDRSC